MRYLTFLLAVACVAKPSPAPVDPVPGDPDIDLPDTAQDTVPDDTDVDSDAGGDTDASDVSQDSDSDLVGCAACDPGALPFGGGLGDAADPSLLCSVAHLDSLRDHPDTRALLCTDLDLIDTVFDPIPVFRGVVQGDGHTLANLVIDRPTESHVGFVVELDGGRLEGISFEDSVLRAYSHAGTVVDVMRNGAVMQGVSVSGEVWTRAGQSGGVVSVVTDGTQISDVRFDGTVTQGVEGGFVGGVVHALRGQGRRLEALGTLTTEAWKAGCIAQELNATGLLEGSVCRMTMNVENRAGGLVGMLVGGTIRGSYFEGQLNGSYWVGGLVGEVYSSPGVIEESYVSGTVVSRQTESGDGGHPLVGRMNNRVTLTEVVWDAERMGIDTDPAGGVGVTTAELHDPTHQAFAGWSGRWLHTPGQPPRLPWE